MSSCLQTDRNAILEYASKYLRGHSFLFDNFFVRRLPNSLNIHFFRVDLSVLIVLFYFFLFFYLFVCVRVVVWTYGCSFYCISRLSSIPFPHSVRFSYQQPVRSRQCKFSNLTDFSFIYQYISDQEISFQGRSCWT